MIDIAMWAKNGERTLPTVLDQIDRVIPREVINKKIMVDDHSTDDTRQIALNHGWIVKPNEGHGISCAANLALNNIETPTFCSFEQDLLLSNEWFDKVYPMIFMENVVVASGVRFPTGPSATRSIEILRHKTYMSNLSKGLIKETPLGQTFDNTVFRTDFVKNLNGFDYLESNAGQDISMSLKISKTRKYQWAVNYNVISSHLRSNSYLLELKHQRWYARAFREIYMSNGIPLPNSMTAEAFAYRLLKSPLTSIKLIKTIKDPFVFYYYPGFCLMQLIGLMEGRRYAHGPISQETKHT